jgi:hypothetical protein
MTEKRPNLVPLKCSFNLHERSLSDEFHAESPNTQANIKEITGGVTPTVKFYPKRMTFIKDSNGVSGLSQTYKYISSDMEFCRNASEHDKEMMFVYGMIPTNCDIYRKYAKTYENSK